MTTRDDSGLLIDGETVVWSGRPAQGLLFTSRDWLLIPFSLLWCGFTIFWEATALSLATAPLFMKLFGAAFVLVGLYFCRGAIPARRLDQKRNSIRYHEQAGFDRPVIAVRQVHRIDTRP